MEARHKTKRRRGIAGRIAIATVTENLDSLPPTVVLRLRNMTAIDAPGIAALEELADILHKSNRSMIICGARPQPEALMREAGFDRHIGTENICPNINEALKRAAMIHQEKQSPIPAHAEG